MIALREKLIKIGAEVMTHSRCVIFQMAEVAVPYALFAAILEWIRWFGVRPPLMRRMGVSPLGERHGDPSQGLVGATAGERLPQHSEQRKRVRFGVQTRALSSDSPHLVEIGQ